MEIPTVVVEALTREGVTGQSTDVEFRSVYEALTGDVLNDLQLQLHRKALRVYQTARPGAPPAVPTEEQAMPRTRTTKARPKTTKAVPVPKQRTSAKKTKEPKPTPAPKVEKAPLTEEQRIAAAGKIMKEFKAQAKPGWERVMRVTEISDAGRPLRVDVRCGADGCKNERNVKVQDVFQVQRCAEHQKTALRDYRNDLAKRKRIAAKKTKSA